MSRWTQAREEDPQQTWLPTAAPWPGRMAWRDVLLLHWRADPDVLAPHVPPGVTLDLADGSPWISLSALRMQWVGPRLLPPLPGFAELNLRTYVTADGKPGVLFLSLHAPNPLVVAGGRALGLPYVRAQTVMRRDGERVRFASRAGDETFAVSYRPDGPLEDDAADHRLHRFLTARYCLYTQARHRSLRIDVRHAPWPLEDVEAEFHLGLRGWAIEGEPELASFARGVDVVVSAPMTVASASDLPAGTAGSGAPAAAAAPSLPTRGVPGDLLRR